MALLKDLPEALQLVILLVGCGLLALIVAITIDLAIKFGGHAAPWATSLRRRIRTPTTFVVAVVIIWIALHVSYPLVAALPWVRQVFAIALVLTLAWFLGSLIIYLIDLGIDRFKDEDSNQPDVRQARTQFLLLRRLTVAATIIIAIGAALLTFPAVQAVGATVLASAGLLSIVAGLAAQSTLSNVFAGVQLAFSGALRIEDTVTVEEEWGQIEEITLTYVIMRIWDGRRLVLPTTYFTQQPYENWTRKSTAVLGTVFFDLDWGVNVAGMRAKLTEILQNSPLWDGEECSLVVTDTTGGRVELRALISASNASDMFSLERVVRESLIAWLQQENPEALPRTRLEKLGESEN